MPRSLPSDPLRETMTPRRLLTSAKLTMLLLAAVEVAVGLGGDGEDLDITLGVALGVAHDEAVDAAAAVAAILGI